MNLNSDNESDQGSPISLLTSEDQDGEEGSVQLARTAVNHP